MRWSNNNNYSMYERASECACCQHRGEKKEEKKMYTYGSPLSRSEVAVAHDRIFILHLLSFSGIAAEKHQHKSPDTLHLIDTPAARRPELVLVCPILGFLSSTSKGFPEPADRPSSCLAFFFLVSLVIPFGVIVS